MKINEAKLNSLVEKYSKLIECDLKKEEEEVAKKEIDDEATKEEVDEELDEQFNMAAAMKDPKIVAAAKRLMAQSGGRFTFKDAIIRAARAGGKTGAMI